MRPLKLALTYLDIFFSGRDVEALRPFLTEDLVFKGPFLKSFSAESYLRALKADPPRHCTYTLIRSFEDESSACVIYQFSKPGLSLPMSQLFEVRDGKISKILVLFDSKSFEKPVV